MNSIYFETISIAWRTSHIVFVCKMVWFSNQDKQFSFKYKAIFGAYDYIVSKFHPLNNSTFFLRYPNCIPISLSVIVAGCDPSLYCRGSYCAFLCPLLKPRLHFTVFIQKRYGNGTKTVWKRLRMKTVWCRRYNMFVWSLLHLMPDRKTLQCKL